jgi:hypothetical protein
MTPSVIPEAVLIGNPEFKDEILDPLIESFGDDTLFAKGPTDRKFKHETVELL